MINRNKTAHWYWYKTKFDNEPRGLFMFPQWTMSYTLCWYRDEAGNVILRIGIR